MLQKMFLIVLSLALLASCSPSEPKVVTNTQYIERNIPIQPRPRGVELSDVKWHVVNRDNVDEFLEQMSITSDTFVFVGITVKDYEKLSLNLDELRRYIDQQNELIVYYEQSITQGD